jgi:hypothetical protein
VGVVDAFHENQITVARGKGQRIVVQFADAMIVGTFVRAVRVTGGVARVAVVSGVGIQRMVVAGIRDGVIMAVVGYAVAVLYVGYRVRVIGGTVGINAAGIVTVTGTRKRMGVRVPGEGMIVLATE